MYIKGKNAKKYRKGREYGSAELGGPKDIEPFINREEPDQNIIFTQTEQMSLAGRMKSPLYNRNKNVLVIGGSGSGKTRLYAKPNLMQLNCSYVFTDPKGTVIEDTVNTDEDGVVTKEFYTITADGKTFYLIVDKQQSQDNVFLLTEAGVNDLLNFVNYNGVDVQNGDIPMYELSDASLGDAATEYLAELNAPKKTDASENSEGTSKNGTADKCVTTGDTNAPAGNKSTIVLVIAIAGVGVVVFLVRSKKRKNDIAEAGDIDEFGGSDDYDDSDDDTDSDN